MDTPHITKQILAIVAEGWGEDVEEADVQPLIELYLQIERENQELRTALELYLMDCEIEKLEHNSDTYNAARAILKKGEE